MSYEPGTRECRIFLSAKQKILDMQSELASLDGTPYDCSNMQDKLKDMYQEIEHMHTYIKEPTTL